MTESFKVKNVEAILSTDEDLGNGRADYTTDIISNVNVTVQADRLSTIIFSNVNSTVDTDPVLPTTADDYDSGWQATGDYTMIRGHMYSNQAGTIYMEQSSMTADTKTAQVQTTQAYLAAGVNGGFTEDIVATYIRIRFIPTVNPTIFVSWARLSN